MSPAGADSDAAWADASLTLALFAIDPTGLGGLCLRGWPGPARERLCAWLRQLLPPGAPLLRLPLRITDDRLLGGLSLAATLRSGRIVEERGLLARADGGVLLAAMAERLEANVTFHLCTALDRGSVTLEREGLSGNVLCRLGVVALDEGIDDERAPLALRDRLAFALDLNLLDPDGPGVEEPDRGRVHRARARLHRVRCPPPMVEALCRAAQVLGIDSLRASLLAVAAARAHAALQGHLTVEDDDATMAARLALGHRAKVIPANPEQEQAEEATSDGPRGDDGQTEDRDDAQAPEPGPTDPASAKGPPLDDLVLAAARSGIPPGLLDALAVGGAIRGAPSRAGTSGAVRSSLVGGRPAGVVARKPRDGERLNVVETLRAAAPWQALRGRRAGRIQIREEDFRVTRLLQRSETRVIFVVDASGSAALQRLAEAKGAVEQVLADCYVRRDHVALLAFRGTGSTLLLPPTRSLVSVRRSLARLAGGGTTPLAAGIEAALALALDGRQRGQTPVLVLMTDGRANVALDGRGDRQAAEADAGVCARKVRAEGVRVLFLDTSPRPRPAAQRLASEMAARYLPLPYLDPKGISRQVQALATAAS